MIPFLFFFYPYSIRLLSFLYPFSISCYPFSIRLLSFFYAYSILFLSLFYPFPILLRSYPFLSYFYPFSSSFLSVKATGGGVVWSHIDAERFDNEDLVMRSSCTFFIGRLLCGDRLEWGEWWKDDWISSREVASDRAQNFLMVQVFSSRPHCLSMASFHSHPWVCPSPCPIVFMIE